MKKILILLSLLVFIMISGCNNLGKEKVFSGTEVYYTDRISADEVDLVGNYLVDQKFADGAKKTVQLDKSGNTNIFRMVVKDGMDKDAGYNKIVKFFATTMSSKLFSGAPVEVQLCDEYMKPLKTINSYNYGKQLDFNGVELFHTPDITDAEVAALGKYLVDSKFADGKVKTVLLTKSGNAYQFRFVVKNGAEKDPAYQKIGSTYASDLSAHVFNNAPVEVAMCDEYLNPLLTVKMQ